MTSLGKTLQVPRYIKKCVNAYHSRVKGDVPARILTSPMKVLGVTKTGALVTKYNGAPGFHVVRSWVSSKSY